MMIIIKYMVFLLQQQVLWYNIFPAFGNLNLNNTQSHPYALTLSSQNDGFVIAGLAINYDENNNPDKFPIGYPVGRMTKLFANNGSIAWDQYFRNNQSSNMNTECYGISIATDLGYIVTCGTGVEPSISDANDSDLQLGSKDTWMALLHRTDVNGNEYWQKCYTNQTQNLNNAGEYVVTTQDGGYAMYIDSNTWGNPGTGGNFGLMTLYSDDN